MRIQTVACRIACAAFLIAAIPLHAATLTIIVPPRPGVSAALKVEVRSPGVSKQIELQPGVEKQIDVEPGTYSVSTTSAGFWSAPRTVSVGEAGSTALLDVHPTVTVRGRYRAPRDAKPPQATTARAVVGDASGVAEIECATRQWQWQCDVPAGTRHLSIKAVGYIARYWWDLNLVADRDFGEQELRTGASFVGYVSLPRDRRDALEQVTVRLTRSSAARSAQDARSTKAEAASLLVHPKKNGFFHFDGIAPGDYIVRASLPGLTSSAQTVHIIENLEAGLRSPLLLEPPHTLSLAVTPPHDANEIPWALELTRETDTQHVFEPARQMRLPKSGRATIQNLPAGRYRLTVRDPAYNGIATRQFILPDDGDFIELQIATFRVAGKVTLGDKPLRAKLWLGGEDRVPAVAVESGDDGRFEAVLPEDLGEEIDEVTVRADLPPVHATIPDLRVIEGESGARTLNIVLPETALPGRVVDELGSPVPNALVNVTPSGSRMIQTSVRTDGTFDLHGITAGPATINAAAGDRKSSAVRVQVSADPIEPVVLVVRKAPLFRGRVVSAAGPVPGAAVYVFPAYERGFAAQRLGTDADGTFQARIPPGSAAVDVFVSAPGFGLTLQRRTVSGEVADISVTQASGELVLEFQRSEEDVSANRWPTISHGGATREVVTLVAVNDRASERQSGRSWTFQLPELEPGDYTFCSGAVCRAVTLPPFGKAAAELRAR